MLNKIVFFILGGNLILTKKFIKQWGNTVKEDFVFPALFLKKLKSFFKKEFSAPHSPDKKNSLSQWRAFCRRHNFEEVFLLVLCGILQLPKDQALWRLKMKPQLFSFRFRQSLLSLGKELASPTADIKQSALNYCQLLSKEPLPEELLHFKAGGGIFKKFLFSAVIFLICLFIIGAVVFLLYQPGGPVVLYYG